MPNFINEPLPTWLQSFFTLAPCGTVMWVSEPPDPAFLPIRLRRKAFPAGAVAGGRTVYGRGRLVTLSGATLLTSDIRGALLDERGEWPDAPLHDPASLTFDGKASDYAVDMAALARLRWYYEDGLRWRQDRGRDRLTGRITYPAGSLVVGLQLSGFRGRAVSTSDALFLASDVQFLLEKGHWPWAEAPAIDWDTPPLGALPYAPRDW